ncbi:Protein ALKB-8 [Aphelenchoides avenae]|nr:Protein ALKB-8 [Aphelenchus avenae]
MTAEHKTTKISKRTRRSAKIVHLLKKHGDDDIQVSETPTQVILALKSGVICGVSPEQLQALFEPFDPNCEYVVYPSKKSYSFIIFSDAHRAAEAVAELQAKPFQLVFVTNAPSLSESTTSTEVQGLLVIEDFLNADEEKDLETFLEPHASYSTQLRNRTVFHFGYTFDYTNTENSARDPATPIPEQLSALIQRFMHRGLLAPGEEPDQVTVNVYGEPGQGIPSHVDTHSAFEEPILSVSLHSDVVMEFKDCANPTVSTDKDEGRRLERKYVEDVYANIAAHFDETRHSQWKAVSGFLDNLAEGSVVFDAGCGNGKYLCSRDRITKIGCDLCEGLVGIARQKGAEVLRGDALSLPVRSDSVDAVISIAVIHHMSTEERRRRAIQEIVRVLRPGGTALVTVWAMDQAVDGESEYMKMRANKENATNAEDKTATNDKLRVHDGKHFAQQDMFVPWQRQQDDGTIEQFLRYYHVFVNGELRSLVESISRARLISASYEQGNWIATFQKV